MSSWFVLAATHTARHHESHCGNEVFWDCLASNAKHLCVRSKDPNQFLALFKVIERSPDVISICIHERYTVETLFEKEVISMLPSQITNLELSRTFLSKDFGDKIIDLLKRQTLQVLNLSKNDIDRAAISICDYLATNQQTSLRILSLNICSLSSEEEFDSVCRMIEKNTYLQDLDVSNNWHYEEANFLKMLKAVAKNNTLTYLNALPSPANFFKGYEDLFRNNFTLQGGNICPDFTRFFDRNRAISSKSIHNSLFESIVPLISLEIPIYVLLYIFDWSIYLNASWRCNDMLHMNFDQIENLHRKKKVQWLYKMLQTFIVE